jgi:hypothetical protein
MSEMKKVLLTTSQFIYFLNQCMTAAMEKESALNCLALKCAENDYLRNELDEARDRIAFLELKRKEATDEH